MKVINEPATVRMRTLRSEQPDADKRRSPPIQRQEEAAIIAPEEQKLLSQTAVGKPASSAANQVLPARQCAACSSHMTTPRSASKT